MKHEGGTAADRCSPTARIGDIFTDGTGCPELCSGARNCGGSGPVFAHGLWRIGTLLRRTDLSGPGLCSGAWDRGGL